MQLHACLLLFIITTDKTLALSHQRCGGNVSLDQKPAGHVSLTAPGLFADTSTLEPTSHRPDETLPVSVCTWTIGVPAGRMVLLKLERGSSVSVGCLWKEDDQVLESGGTVLLSGCDGNKASLSWSGAGHSSNEIELSYYVQEEERNSSEDHTSPHSERDLVRRSQTGTTSTAPVGGELVTGTGWGRGRRYEGLEEWSSASSPSSQDLLDPTSPLQGLAGAGRADREALPLPEEEPNNRADTSGGEHTTDKERTHPCTQSTFHTPRSVNTETNSSNELHQTQAALKHATGSCSNAVAQTLGLSPTVQAHPFASISDNPDLTSSPSEPSSRTTLESGTILSPHDGEASGRPHSWRSLRSTDRLNSDLTSAVTSDPLTSQSGDSGNTAPTASTSSSQDASGFHTPTTRVTELYTAVATTEAASLHPSSSGADSFASAASDVSSQTPAFESSAMPHASTSSTQRHATLSTESVTHSPTPHISSPFTQTSNEAATQSTQTNFPVNAISSSSGSMYVDNSTFSPFTPSPSTPRTVPTLGDAVLSPTATNADLETYTLHPTYTLLHDRSSTSSPTPAPHSSSTHSSTPLYTFHTRTTFSEFTHASSPSPSSTTESAVRTPPVIKPTSQTHTIQSSPHTQTRPPVASSTKVPHEQTRDDITTTTTTHTPLSLTTADEQRGGDVEKEDESWQWFRSSAPTVGPPPQMTSQPSQERHTTHAASVIASTWSTTTSPAPKFYIVPDQPAAIRVETIELLLQIIVEESRSAFDHRLEEDTTAWVEPYLQRAPGFTRLLGVWSSGHAVQSLVEFKTSGALQWLGMTGSTSLLERTGLAQAVREGRSFRSSKITNITLGGLQGDVCDWLLQCQAGYKCVSQPSVSNYSCFSVCHFEYCHHHGICTHHPGQLPVCRCLVGEDFWYMGQRCNMRMTRARLVGACLAILLVMVTVIGVLALVAVRRYRAILIQAKVDQTRSSYRRFNHFDELSGRFWLRSWAGSADSLDNPAFTRSDELLHLRALDRPCCYHDDTLSLASTCPSHGTRINTIYPHSSQYGWRGSEMSMGDGVLDSGKASDLSVCSWPVEPIQWTPFPLLQQLASHRTPTVRMSRPRSYCEGMELVDMGKSWTA